MLTNKNLDFLNENYVYEENYNAVFFDFNIIEYDYTGNLNELMFVKDSEFSKILKEIKQFFSSILPY